MILTQALSSTFPNPHNGWNQFVQVLVRHYSPLYILHLCRTEAGGLSYFMPNQKIYNETASFFRLINKQTSCFEEAEKIKRDPKVCMNSIHYMMWMTITSINVVCQGILDKNFHYHRGDFEAQDQSLWALGSIWMCVAGRISLRYAAHEQNWACYHRYRTCKRIMPSPRGQSHEGLGILSRRIKPVLPITSAEQSERNTAPLRLRYCMMCNL